MKVIKLADGRSGSQYTSPRFPTDKMIWHRVDAKQDYPDALVVYGNYCLQDALNHKVGTRVAWLSESRGVAWWTYEFLEDHLEYFDHVLTHDDSLVKLDPQRVTLVPRGECWIDAGDIKIYPKSRLVSFISSDKKFEQWAATGHGFRQDFYKILTSKKGALGRLLERSGALQKIDIYGSITGCNLPTKIPSLQEYRYQVTVENMIHDCYFTEKLLDCFATGTIPIYRGTHRVIDFFNPEGILFFSSLEELTDILTNLSEQDYEGRMAAVEENFELAKEYFSRERLLCRYSDLLSW